jgi:hypothetical protein
MIDDLIVVGTLEVHQAATKARGALESRLFWNELSVLPDTREAPRVDDDAALESAK